jgi:hypothetical protein
MGALLPLAFTQRKMSLAGRAAFRHQHAMRRKRTVAMRRDVPRCWRCPPMPIADARGIEQLPIHR